MSATFFTFAGQRLGSAALNRIRLALATAFLIAAHWIMQGAPLPIAASPDRWLWLGLSGIVGLVLGDAFLLQAYLWIGPRLSMLMMSLHPIIAALVAWLFLGETLNPRQILGIALALSGIGWVVLGRQSNGQNGAPNPHYARGILFGLGAATGQALGLVLARQGAYGGFPALSGTLMRMIAAATTIWIVALVSRQVNETFKRLAARPRALLFVLVGVFFGPSLGISLSLFAVQHAPIGVASTLMALPPVVLLPVGYFVFKERFGWGAVAGTLVAIAGVGLLFWT
jgi:drug/metabolite transporter (DMT)-like permease